MKRLFIMLSILIVLSSGCSIKKATDFQVPQLKDKK